MILHDCTGTIRRDTGAELRFDSPVDISITSFGNKFLRVNLPTADDIPRVIVPTPNGMKLGCGTGPHLLEGEILMFAFTGVDDEQRGQKVQYHRTAGPRQRVRIHREEEEIQVLNTCRMKRHLSDMPA